MEIFTNWIFWTVLATIIFLLAVIGYLAESKKKTENKEDVKD